MRNADNHSPSSGVGIEGAQRVRHCLEIHPVRRIRSAGTRGAWRESPWQNLAFGVRWDDTGAGADLRGRFRVARISSAEVLGDVKSTKACAIAALTMGCLSSSAVYRVEMGNAIISLTIAKLRA
jgi:hypothetical protein